MNILFLTLDRISDISSRGIYTDLIREFVRHGHSFYVVKPNERSTGKPTTVADSCGVKILGVRTLNIQKTNIVEKGVGTLLLEYQYARAINKYFNGVKFDLVLYSTPPITFNKVIDSLKKSQGVRTYLLLKDIFPQNAVDLEMFSKNSLFYKLFRKKEKRLYELSDYIGCMSPANVRYVLEHNLGIDKKKVEVCPNCIELQENVIKENREEVLARLNIPTDKTVFIYGGNLGKPQGVDFLLKVIEANERLKDSYIVIVGNGTEFFKVATWMNEHRPMNACLLTALPKQEYDKLVRACDIGLIFLDRRFTIPNYPSRLLSYLENKMPVLMATDKNTDIGSIARDNGYGDWVESGDVEGFVRLLKKFSQKTNEMEKMGERGYDFLRKQYTVANGYKIIMSHFD